jgi:hypothetical protein
VRDYSKMQPLTQPEDREGITGRALPFGATTLGGAAAMTVDLCLTACQAAGYILAGTEYSDECCKIAYTLFHENNHGKLSYMFRVWQYYCKWSSTCPRGRLGM